VFKLTFSKKKGWTESTQYTFTGGADGGQPQDGLILDKQGNLYGTALAGGSTGNGAVFQITQ
jgi:uncharacterized repeat protein (TIGR03803 family)